MRDKKIIRFLKIIIILLILVCLIQIINAYRSSATHKQQQEELKSFIQTENISNTEISELEEISTVDYLTELMENLIYLYNENHDLAGWIYIEGTEIDYPVMKCENDYYLYRNFYKQDDKYGSLYVKEMADIDTPGTNFVVYGHNMKDGSMFGSLDEYSSIEFYRDHSKIIFLTLEEEREYEVMAVFRTQLKDEKEVFKYYQFYQADTEEDFLYFYRNVKKLSLYDTGVTAEFGETFLTLSTCDYYSDDSRFVVVAKRIDK